jgi:ethanolamine utilization protein EutA
LLDHLGLPKKIGDELHEAERGEILDAYLGMLDALIACRSIDSPLQASHEQVPLAESQRPDNLAVTFSGGVGELIYRHLNGAPWPSTTAFGDLGIDLAKRLVDWIAADPRRYRLRPTSGGRAVSFGLLRHATEISGSTLFLPRPEVLPLADVPILGELRTSSSETDLHAALQLTKRSPTGAALQIVVDGNRQEGIKSLGERIAAALREVNYPKMLPLVLLLRENLGKTLGHYATAWSSLPMNLLVIDEITPRDAQYVQIGAPRNQVVPVSFYGLRPTENAS